MDQTLAMVNYYIREGLWHSIQSTCEAEMRKGVEPVLIFWKAYGLFKEGNVTEAIREVESIQNRREATFACTIALIFYHENCRIVDRETVDALSFQSETAEQQANDKDLLTASTFYLHVNELKKATQTLQRVIDNNPSNLNALALKGWIYLSAPKEDYVNKSIQIFDTVLNEEEGGSHKHIEALLGRAKYYEKVKKFQYAIEILNEVVIMYKTFIPAAIEKARVHTISGDWEQALETTQRVLVSQGAKFNIEALRMYVFYLLSRENNTELVLEKMDELFSALQMNEPKNAQLYYNIARLFARICGRKAEVLEKTMELVDKACALCPETSAYTTELGYQRALLGDYNGAFQIYQKAASQDEGNMEPLYGMIYCRVLSLFYSNYFR